MYTLSARVVHMCKISMNSCFVVLFGLGFLSYDSCLVMLASFMYYVGANIFFSFNN